MKIAVLSGKGGTGKTFVSVNLAAAAQKAVYIDCDVEEPNGRLFLRPKECREETVCKGLPAFDAEKCTGCRKCVEFCAFNALIYVKEKPMVFADVCHDCGGCALVCPEQAVGTEERQVGIVEEGRHGRVRVVTGVLNIGEVSAVPVIQAALRSGMAGEETVVIDCPPGSGCSVMESVRGADCCVLAAEPTAFGFHNFKMVHKLVKLLGKSCYVVINKENEPYEPLEKFCEENQVPILCRIPYSRRLAELGAEGRIASEAEPEYAELFAGLLQRLRKEVGA